MELQAVKMHKQAQLIKHNIEKMRDSQEFLDRLHMCQETSLTA